MAKKTRRRTQKTRSGKGAKRRPAAKRAGARHRASARSVAARRKTARARTRTGKAPRKGARRAKGTQAAKTTRRVRRAAPARRGGTGREETLAQTAQAGRTSLGPTNPMPTRRSTGTPAGAGSTRRAPALERARRQLREVEESVPGPPSSLDLDRRASAARTGRQQMHQSQAEHNETSPVLTGGDADASWEDAYSVGDEAPGGDNPTPDQDRVDDIGKALGVEYQDNEELKASDKVAERDRHRWELDPASSEDYKDRD